jgi:hypothetical protein
MSNREFFPMQLCPLPPGWRKVSVAIYQDGTTELVVQEFAALALGRYVSTDTRAYESEGTLGDEPGSFLPVLISEGQDFACDDEFERECLNTQVVGYLSPGEVVPGLDSPEVKHALEVIQKAEEKRQRGAARDRQQAVGQNEGH